MRETLPTALDDYGADQRFGLVGGASTVLFTTFYYFTSSSSTTTTTTHTHTNTQDYTVMMEGARTERGC